MKSVLDVNKHTIRQCFLGTAVVIDLFLSGAGYTFSATLLPKLKANDSLITITPSEEIWIASVPSLACMPGAILSPFLMELFGRKWSYVTVATWNILVWLIMSYSTHVWQLLLGRVLQGFNEGLSYSLSTCFIVEVAPLKHRSKLLNMINLGTALGMLYVDVMGSFHCWRASAFILACLAALDVAILMFMKNTHVWYLQRGRLADARAAYFWYRPQDDANARLLNEEIDVYKHRKHISFAEVRSEWTRREFLIPLLIMVWFTVTVITSGGHAIALYSVDIMSNVMPLDGHLTTIIIDAMRVAAAVMTVILLEYTPIRWMINTASIFCSVSLLILTGTLHWEEAWIGLPILSITMLFMYYVFYHIGFVNMWSVCLGELFTGVAKPTGTALVAMSFFGLHFGLGQVIPIMFHHLGDKSFLLFAVCNAIGGVGLFFLMPETKGLSNEEIRANFRKSEPQLTWLHKYEGPGAF